MSEGRTLMRHFADRAFGSTAISALLARFADRAEDLKNFDPLEELLMNFFAGIETTTSTLSFAIDRLGSDPRIQQRLYDEIQAADEDKYLNCFIQETMRFFPPIPFVVREAAANDSLNGVTLSKGQVILISVVGLHHNGSYWNEPEIFDCSRSEFLNDSYNRRAFLPFLAGPRMCGGARLAKLELIEGLKAAVRQFTFGGRTDDVGFDYGLALRPKSWTEVNFSRRQWD
jgi:cytochrome P450